MEGLTVYIVFITVCTRFQEGLQRGTACKNDLR